MGVQAKLSDAAVLLLNMSRGEIVFEIRAIDVRFRAFEVVIVAGRRHHHRHGLELQVLLDLDAAAVR